MTQLNRAVMSLVLLIALLSIMILVLYNNRVNRWVPVIPLAPPTSARTHLPPGTPFWQFIP